MEYKDQQVKILEEVANYAKNEISNLSYSIEKNDVMPKNLITKMAQEGYLAASFPKEYGGLALDPVHYGLFTEEIGKACCSLRALITVHTSLVGESILRWGTKEQKNYWLLKMAKGEKIGAFALTEPNVGSDAKNVQTEFKKNGNKYILNGKKKWITFGDIADFFIVIASNNGKVSAFIVERNFKGVLTNPIKGLLAGKGTHIASIELQNVEVPEENLLGKEGAGFTYIVSTALDHGRYSIAWAGVAIAQAALEEMVSYARKRKQFDKRICHFQLIQGIIADAVTKVHAARALCLKAGEKRMVKDEDSLIETSIAKYFSSQVANKVTSDAVQVHGANGCIDEYKVEGLFREAKVLEIIEGTSQIQQEIISMYGLRKYNKPK